MALRVPYRGHTQADGTVVTIQRTRIDSNVADSRGGGIYTAVGSGGEMNIEDSVITGNQAGTLLTSYQGEIPNSR